MDELQKALQFVSTSSDGRVMLWTITKSELQHECIMRLNAPTAAVGRDDGEDETAAGVSGGTCLAFNKVSDALFRLWTCWRVARIRTSPNPSA